ncbi:MAG TPA: phosphatase PAP2 family protein [Roseiarcus sp.]
MTPIPRILLALVAGLVAVGVVFAIWPELDLAATHAFYDHGGFVVRSGWAQAVRSFFRITPYVALAAYAIPYLLRRLGVAAPWAPDGRAIAFLVATMVIGPGLIVNLGMKDHLHRPRPINMIEFGGRDEFRPWYRFDGACRRNCSFASGEAASAFWMVAPALLVPQPFRAVAIAAALAFGIAASALRMAFGGHFLSDVLFGGLISLIVVFAVRWALWPRGGGP